MEDTLILPECECCGAPNALPLYRPEGESEALCPRCTRNAVLIDAATADLHAQLAPVLKAWATRWEGVGLSGTALGEVLSCEGTHWHPLGYRGRSGHADDNARAFIAEVLTN